MDTAKTKKQKINISFRPPPEMMHEYLEKLAKLGLENATPFAVEIFRNGLTPAFNKMKPERELEFQEKLAALQEVDKKPALPKAKSADYRKKLKPLPPQDPEHVLRQLRPSRSKAANE